jgi:hypothetical protein
MSLWDDVSERYDTEINAAAETYVKATNILPYTVKDLKAVFTPDEMDNVARFIKELNEAKEDNERKAKIIS